MINVSDNVGVTSHFSGTTL